MNNIELLSVSLNKNKFWLKHQFKSLVLSNNNKNINLELPAVGTTQKGSVG